MTLSKKNTPHVNKYAAIIVLLTAEAVKSWFLYAGDRRAPPLGWRGGLKKYTHFLPFPLQTFFHNWFLFIYDSVLVPTVLWWTRIRSELRFTNIASAWLSYISAFCTYCMHFLSLSIPLQAPMYIYIQTKNISL